MFTVFGIRIHSPGVWVIVKASGHLAHRDWAVINHYGVTRENVLVS
jgi:hypothetical protein